MRRILFIVLVAIGLPGYAAQSMNLLGVIMGHAQPTATLV
jgi:hypothetical protein